MDLSEKVLAAKSASKSICDKWRDMKLINATACQSFGKTMWSWSRLRAFSLENPISNEQFPSVAATTIQMSLANHIADLTWEFLCQKWYDPKDYHFWEGWSLTFAGYNTLNSLGGLPDDQILICLLTGVGVGATATGNLLSCSWMPQSASTKITTWPLQSFKSVSFELLFKSAFFKVLQWRLPPAHNNTLHFKSLKVHSELSTPTDLHISAQWADKNTLDSPPSRISCPCC